MNKKKFYSTIIVLIFLLVSIQISAQESKRTPVAISPGSGTEVVSVWRSCPTFSWSAVDQASSYRVVVFEVVDSEVTTYEDISAVASSVISKAIPGPALSWTLPAEERLKTGSMYSWYVQAVDAYGNAVGSWSNGNIFKVEQEVLFAGVEEKLAEKMREYGINEETISNVLKDVKSEVKEIVVRGSGSDSNINNNPGMSRIQGTEGANTYYGLYAGSHNTTGYWNTFVGYSAGEVNTTGYQNAFFGDAAGAYNIGGYQNTFIGQYAGVKNTSGHTNTFLGFSSGYKNTDGDGNTFVGANAGYSNTTANGNTFIGASAGEINTTGTANTFCGVSAGAYNTIGYANTFVGSGTGYDNTEGYANTFVGDEAGANNTTGYLNTFIGKNTGQKNTTGIENTFIGNGAGYKTTMGGGNTFIGVRAGESNTTGNDNIILGYEAGYSNTTGLRNIFLGYKAGYNETGSNKLYISSLNTNFPLIYGEFDNGIVGINGQLGVGTKTPLGTFEIEKTGANAVFIFERTDGAQGKFTARPNEIFIGSGSNHNVEIVANNNRIMTLIPGGYVGIGTSTPSYPLHMASGAYCSTGGTWTNASSRSLKENIRDLTTAEAVEALFKLNPVKYNYKVDVTDKHVGFIAEDVPELVATADRKGLSPMDVTAVLTKVVQEQQKVIFDLQKRLTKIEKK